MATPHPVRRTSGQRQHGMVLIMLVFIVGLVLTAYLVHALDANAVRIERDKKTAAALSLAKAALIGRATGDDNRPGSLPCPDTDGNGSAELLAGNDCPSYLGRFPWRTLGTDRLVDGHGETLWYALSPNYRDDDSAEPINANNAGSLSIDGTGDVVAIVISPGAPLAGQDNRPSNNVVDYLEGENSDGDSDYANLAVQGQNDKLLFINRANLFLTVALRVLGEIRGNGAQGLRGYYASHASTFPFADTDNDGHEDPAQLAGTLPFGDIPFIPAYIAVNNNWLPLVNNYTVSADRQSASLTLNGVTLAITP